MPIFLQTLAWINPCFKNGSLPLLPHGETFSWAPAPFLEIFKNQNYELNQHNGESEGTEVCISDSSSTWKTPGETRAFVSQKKISFLLPREKMFWIWGYFSSPPLCSFSFFYIIPEFQEKNKKKNRARLDIFKVANRLSVCLFVLYFSEDIR